MLQQLRTKNWYVTLTNWEYWPWYIANIPVFGFVLWFAFKARKLFFFSAVNPAIETGGVLGESKIDILSAIPAAYVPLTLFFKRETSFEAVIQEMGKNNLEFPVVAKPNVGERGFLVSKIESSATLKNYMEENKVDFLIQEFVPGPLEMSILHYLPPGQQKGKTTSICIKNFLEVTGDGVSNVRSLMLQNPRAKLQVERFESEFPDVLFEIPPKGKSVLLEPIGNHCRGTTFLSGNHLIDNAVTAVFDDVMAQMKDIHYGRFDLRCTTVEALRQGQFKVMEFNGIAAEPAHIYDPSIPVSKKYRIIYEHWRFIYDLYLQQKARGKKPMTFAEAMESYRKYSAYKKAALKD
ncbi:MAG: hypothetical protein KDC24_02280 [Saprospiraceae bacterium]|nr:hypothetical protein [Saprospiraceae bacterium]